MAQVPKVRKALALTTVAVLLASSLGEVAPASALSLPLETPTVPVKAPPLPPVKTPPLPPVKTPPLPPVKTPPLPPVKAPPLPPVKTPTVPVKAPPLPPVKTPTVPVKTPAPPVKAPTVPPKAPTLPSKTPSVSVKTPAVGAKTPARSVSVPSATVNVPSVPAGGRSSGPAGGPRGGATRAGTASSAAASSPRLPGSGAGAPALGTYGSPGAGGSPGVGVGVGLNKLPATEGSPGKRARARIARRERRLKAEVARLGGCLTALPAGQRELLELRTGYGNALPLSPRAAAHRLHVNAAHIAARERRAVRELLAAARTHSCGRTSEVVAGVVSFIAATFGDGQARATGGVEAVRYESAPAKSGRTSPSTVGGIIGANISPTASDVILVLALLMGLGAIVAVVLADAAGLGPRHEQWRQRVRNRFRSLR